MDERDEVTIARHQDKAPDIWIGKERLHRVDTEIHVDAILNRTSNPANILIVVVGGHVDRLNRICVERTCDPWVAIPIGVSP